PPSRSLHISLLSSSRHHPVLHPFPTRRSSDLRPSAWPISTPYTPRSYPMHCRKTAASKVCILLLMMSAAGCASKSSLPVTMQPRSEEHTSELQSRENLVCRLLLEKKNTDCM